VPVGPGRPAIVAPLHGSGGQLGSMSEYPVQVSKVQAPPLRDETLERVRLLEWLHVKIHRRVVLVMAEAGYGKTTLLADYSRRSRVRTLWFRLDRGDRDWVGFIAYLVAAVRIHIPDFAAVTQSLLRETGGTAPPRDTVLDTFIRELGDLPADPTALVLDDLHAVDDSVDVRHILRELLSRAPERLTFVLISRKQPPLPLARLRALGEVAELRTSELRFDASETEQLFRETYALALDASVVAELSRRTEGWAASLQLVRTAIRDRTPSEIRAFVASLSGAEGQLYDYLAEEVVGELSGELQQFLMRTSLLDIVEPVLGSVAAAVTPDETRAAIAEGELIGLFSRTGPQARDQVRAHPLVRDFLQARLLRSIGEETVASLHRSIAIAAEAIDWRTAGHHYVASGDLDDARRVLANAIESILATGAYAAAEALAMALPPRADPDANVLVVLSRLAQQRGQSASGREFAEAAYLAQPDQGAVILNLVTARLVAGDVVGAVDLLEALETASGGASIAMMARAVRAMIDCSVSGNLDLAAAKFEALMDAHSTRGEYHFLGVALTNLAYIRKAQRRPQQCLDEANEAIAHLQNTSAGIELVSAQLVRAWALAHLGDLDQARREVAAASSVAPEAQAIEVAWEAAEIELLYGDPERAARWIHPYRSSDPETDQGEQALLVSIHADLLLGRNLDAQTMLGTLRHGAPRTSISFEVRRFLVEALASVIAGDDTWAESAAQARSLAVAQGAYLWSGLAQILESSSGEEAQSVATAVDLSDAATLTLAADHVALNLAALPVEVAETAAGEAILRPERWRPALRRGLGRGDGESQYACAKLLDLVGAQQDVRVLRRAAKTLRSIPGAASLGRGLARKLAPRVRVDDLGRVHLRVGDRDIDGSMIRRKVLALLVFLVTRPAQSATREEVLEALWPDLPPSTALNSLNQTVYFLRRVFEPTFTEDLTASYVGQDGETVWLDRELVTTQSQQCRELIRGMPGSPDPEGAVALARAYVGRFALDFMYEDWASAYRDSLHAAYLRVIEGAVRADADSGHYARGVEIAELAVEVEPDSEELQVALLRLYRLAGSHAAAAEQYGHYAMGQRDIGIEPQPLATL
jgi:LuxR family maltose regulon positive regulatory protein